VIECGLRVMNRRMVYRDIGSSSGLQTQ
jgi:hypothetical protein